MKRGRSVPGRVRVIRGEPLIHLDLGAGGDLVLSSGEARDLLPHLAGELAVQVAAVLGGTGLSKGATH